MSIPRMAPSYWAPIPPMSRRSSNCRPLRFRKRSERSNWVSKENKGNELDLPVAVQRRQINLSLGIQRLSPINVYLWDTDRYYQNALRTIEESEWSVHFMDGLPDSNIEFEVRDRDGKLIRDHMTRDNLVELGQSLNKLKVFW